VEQLLLAGQKLSNIGFNLGTGRQFDKWDRNFADKTRRDWDAAMVAIRKAGLVLALRAKPERKAKRNG
jgi:hypothetical protein